MTFLVRIVASAAAAAVGAGLPVACGGTDTAASRPPTASTAVVIAATSSSGGETAPSSTSTVQRGRSRARSQGLPKPHIVWDPIPFGARRKTEMAAYVRRHYGSFMRPTWRLIHPHVIVIHYTDGPSFQSAWNTFADDVPDSELHELPATCAHFVIDRTGTIYQLVSLGTMCRHTVGLNWTAIGIEHVGYSDGQVLGNSRTMVSSLRLVRWLRCRFKIPIADVIGHNESLSSPYHREDVPSLRTQTHNDFNHADMNVYRSRLSRLGGC